MAAQKTFVVTMQVRTDRNLSELRGSKSKIKEFLEKKGIKVDQVVGFKVD